MEVDIYDPWADPKEVKQEYGLDILTEDPLVSRPSSLVPSYGAIILAVAHNDFQKIDMLGHKEGGAIIYDVKGILPKEVVDARL